MDRRTFHVRIQRRREASDETTDLGTVDPERRDDTDWTGESNGCEGTATAVPSRPHHDRRARH